MTFILTASQGGRVTWSRGSHKSSRSVRSTIAYRSMFGKYFWYTYMYMYLSFCLHKMLQIYDFIVELIIIIIIFLLLYYAWTNDIFHLATTHYLQFNLCS